MNDPAPAFTRDTLAALHKSRLLYVFPEYPVGLVYFVPLAPDGFLYAFYEEESVFRLATKPRTGDGASIKSVAVADHRMTDTEMRLSNLTPRQLLDYVHDSLQGRIQAEGLYVNVSLRQTFDRIEAWHAAAAKQ